MKIVAIVSIVIGVIALGSSASTAIVNKNIRASSWIVPVGITGSVLLIGGIILLTSNK